MITITFVHETDDDGLVDVDMVEFGDPTNTFGVKRDDTDEVLVANGVDIPRVSLGTYIYELAEPEPGLAYTYWIRWTYQGATQSREFNVVGATPQPVSAFFTWEEFVRRWGLKNVSVASNKENATAGPDYGACQDAFIYADNEVQDAMRGGIYAIPLDFSINGNIIPPKVKRWAMIIAYADLYDVRGWSDADRIGNKISKLLKNTYDEMSLYRSGVRNLPAMTVATSSGARVSTGASVVSNADLPPPGYDYINGVLTYVGG